MSILDKVKGFIGGNEIQAIINDFNDTIKAENVLLKESKKRIASLMAYGKVETPTLRDAFESLSENFENIDSSREEKIDQMQEKVIKPLNILLKDYKVLSDEVKESEKAQKDLDKAKSKLSKLKGKPKEKLKPGQLENAETAVENAEKTAEKEESEAKEATRVFNTKKVETLKTVLDSIISIEKDFHDKVIGLMNTAKEKTDAIDLDERPAEVPE